MTKADIITLPHPHLRQTSKRVAVITPEIAKLARDMEAAVRSWDKSREHEVTVALAAVQVDALLRVVIIRDDFEAASDATYTTLINPEITKYEGEMTEDYEGCLSIKHMYGKVPRYNKIRFKATGLEGQHIRSKANGFLARVLQHEIDHTKGILFIDHIKDKPEAFYKLTDSGKLEKLDYEKDIRNNRILW